MAESIPFRYRLRVRYGECDAQKVVFNARYGDYVDVATVEFLRAVGLGAAMLDGEFDFQIVKQTTEWRAPARFDDVLELSVAAARVGNTSFTLRTEFRVAGKDAPLATTESVYVNVDPHTLAKLPVCTAVRAMLARGAAGLVVDHAGSSSRTQTTEMP